MKMKMSTLAWVVVVALLAVSSAQATLFFCQDSQWDPAQPAFGSRASFDQERAQFKELRDFFYNITRDVDLGDTTDPED